MTQRPTAYLCQLFFAMMPKDAAGTSSWSLRRVGQGPQRVAVQCFRPLALQLDLNKHSYEGICKYQRHFLAVKVPSMPSEARLSQLGYLHGSRSLATMLKEFGALDGQMDAGLLKCCQCMGPN